MATESGSVDRDRQAKTLRRCLLAPLTGLGQIMFQNSALTGTFFLTGIAVVSPLMAGGAALGAIVGTLTAYLLRYDTGEICDGIYGFNAALVGIALFSYRQPQILTFVLAIAAPAVSAMLTRAMRQRIPFPTYTTPFIITTWLALFVAQELQIPVVVHPPQTQPQTLDLASAVVNGISEVMFQANVLTGALFVVGILLSSWKAALWAVVGSWLGLLIGLSHQAPELNLSLGIYGYNASLAAMALPLYRRSFLLPVMGAVVSVPITEKFPLLGLETLTAPFVLASWIVIVLDKIDTKLYGREPKTAE